MTILVIVLIVGGMLVLANFAQGLSATGEPPPAPKAKTFTHQALVDGPGLFEFDIVGEAHYQDALDEICGGKVPGGHDKEVWALLFPDDDNPHDPKAVCVQINKRTVGYLSRQHARELRAQAPHASVYWKVKAKIVGGWDNGDGDEGYYGVKLDLPVGTEV